MLYDTTIDVIDSWDMAVFFLFVNHGDYTYTEMSMNYQHLYRLATYKLQRLSS